MLLAHAMDAALQQPDIDAMAATADLVVLENRVFAASLVDPMAIVNSISGSGNGNPGGRN